MLAIKFLYFFLFFCRDSYYNNGNKGGIRIMKKLFKCAGVLAAAAAAVAGGLALYKKFFAPDEDLTDLDEELEEEFEEDLDAVPERGYVSLSGAAEAAEDVAEDVKEAAEAVAEDVKEAVEDVAEDVKEAAEE